MTQWLINTLRDRVGHHRLLWLATQPRWSVDAQLRRLVPRRVSPHKIALVSMWDEGFRAIADVTAANKAAYCRRHGYAWRPITTLLAPHLPPAWSKIPSLLQVLPDYEWVMWTDADSIITNPAISLDRLIATGADLVITADHNGLNSGEFLIRRCPWSLAFLRAVLAASDDPAFLAKLRQENTSLQSDGYYEQRAIMWLLDRYSEFRHVRMLPQRAMNSYAPGYHRSGPEADHAPGDFILHLPGMDRATRLEIFARYLAEPSAKPPAA